MQLEILQMKEQISKMQAQAQTSAEVPTELEEVKVEDTTKFYFTYSLGRSLLNSIVSFSEASGISTLRREDLRFD